VRPAEFSFEHPRVHDSDEILEIGVLPKTLAIVGAGVIGAEYACTFAALGVEVHLIDGRDSLLGFLDREISENIQSADDRGRRAFYLERKVTPLRCAAHGRRHAHAYIGRDAGGERRAGRGRAARAIPPISILPPLVSRLANVAYSRWIAQYRTEVQHILQLVTSSEAPALAATGMEQARMAMCVACELNYKDVVAPILPTGNLHHPRSEHRPARHEESLKAKGVAYVVGRARYMEQPAGADHRGRERLVVKLIFRPGRHAFARRACCRRTSHGTCPPRSPRDDGRIRG